VRSRILLFDKMRESASIPISLCIFSFLSASQKSTAMSKTVVNRTTKQHGRVSLEHDTAHREPNEN
jgi:hypothetical protein